MTGFEISALISLVICGSYVLVRFISFIEGLRDISSDVKDLQESRELLYVRSTDAISDLWRLEERVTKLESKDLQVDEREILSTFIRSVTDEATLVKNENLPEELRLDKNSESSYTTVISTFKVIKYWNEAVKACKEKQNETK
jgi:hypothetical protein